jgi:hypothetical protein
LENCKKRNQEKTKDKNLTFQEKELIPTKVYVGNRMLERVNKSTYLGYTLSYREEGDTSDKIARYTKQWD